MREPPEDDGEAGFVLLSVLLAMVLFVGFAASIAVKSRLSAMQTANRVEAAIDGALVDGATLFAVDALRQPASFAPQAAQGTKGAPTRTKAEPAGTDEATGPRDERALAFPFPLNGEVTACRVGPSSVLDVRIVDQGGLVDLNTAPVQMLDAFFRAAGVSSDVARSLAEETADFRDADDDPQSNGIPEGAQYAEKGLSWGPRNAPFADPAEFGQLPSATPELVSRLQPMLTVFNPKASVDLDAMDRVARAALPRDAARLPDIERWQVPSDRTEFSVEVRLRRADGSLAAGRRAQVGAKGGDLQIRQWQSSVSDFAATPISATASPLCIKLTRALAAAVAP